jgi:cell division septal protein FtsQ
LKKSPPRRRSRPTFRARLRTYWLLGLVIAGLVAWAGVSVARLPVFHLKSLAVTGLSRVSRADVVARAAIDPNADVWLLNRTAIRRRLEAIPYVDTARVHVRPPADVWIELSERVPEACVRDGTGVRVTIDAARRVLEPGCNGALPVYALRGRIDATPGGFLHDDELEALQSDARALAGRGDRYLEFDHDTFGQLEATLAGGIRVRFGDDDDDLAGKQRLIGPILAQLGPRAVSVSAVDLRAPATPVVEYRK